MIVWVILLAVPLQGFASATMSLCAQPPAAAQYDHDHDYDMMSEDGDVSDTIAHDGHAAPGMRDVHHPASNHHSGKCAACASCCSCVSMAPSVIVVVPLSASPSLIVPFDQHSLPSVDLALPERPPRA